MPIILMRLDLMNKPSHMKLLRLFVIYLSSVF